MKNTCAAPLLLLLPVLFACDKQDRASGPAATPSPPALATAPSAAPTTGPAIATATPSGSPSAAAAKVWNFDADSTSAPPKGFSFGRTGDGREGKWLVRAESGAPSGANVLVQTDADTTDYRFPVALVDDSATRDVDVSVRCKQLSGNVDRACGLTFRARDANNYYVTRANALENNVRLYFVKDGKRQQIASFSGKVSSGEWHELRAVAEGDHLTVYWEGAKIIDAHDKTFGDAGKVGLWTKADTVTAFDDLKIKPL